MKRERRDGGPRSRRGRASRGSRKKAQKAEPAPPSRRRPAFATLPSATMPRFAGISSFLRLPVVDASDGVPSVDVLLLGLPFDAGTSFRAGARFGPRAVREASSLARRFSQALGIDIYEELRVADAGDLPLTPHDIDQALELISARSEAIARSGVIGGFVGGDQTVTLGVLRGIQRAKLKPVGLLHIDAHSNTAPAAWGREVHHGSVIRLAVEEGLVRPDSVIQVGIRGPYSSGDDLAFALSSGFEIVNVDEVKWDIHSVLGQVRKVARQGAIYVSVDICAVDPAYAPGTGIPTPGGMSSWELQQILRALVGADVVGFDVVEICPPHDHAGITAQLGVSIVQEILSSIADTRRSVRPAPSTHGGEGRRGKRLSP